LRRRAITTYTGLADQFGRKSNGRRPGGPAATNEQPIRVDRATPTKPSYPLTTPSGVSRRTSRTRDAEAAMTVSMSLSATAASCGPPSGSSPAGRRAGKRTPRSCQCPWPRTARCPSNPGSGRSRPPGRARRHWGARSRSARRFSRDAMAGQPPLNFEEQLMTTGAAEGPRDADREDRQRQVGDRARAASGQAGRGPDDRMPDLRATGLAPSNPR